ncbi:hypothetical protein [Actinokineospora bangkokensis]|uniref:Integral membrane protein n=1 Tax=Actinokineospora bangkokensis TaxID=1193682 RepID=A0A1Q9LEC8_9PSEU|nr:hypothetical protein [Actinokineospora bangkokensis]OLR90398.1 hypothetical protein BJP25_27490 [Actinokineospora bangkokensis]
MPLTANAPRTVLGAGALIALQGLAALVFTVVLLVEGLGGGGALGTRTVLGEVAYFAVFTGGVVACASGLFLGRTWARGPSIVLEVLVAGAAWYAIGPSGRPEIGVPVAVVAVAALVLLFHPRTTLWAHGDEGSD